jgi:hypothetical protein
MVPGKAPQTRGAVTQSGRAAGALCVRVVVRNGGRRGRIFGAICGLPRDEVGQVCRATSCQMFGDDLEEIVCGLQRNRETQKAPVLPVRIEGNRLGLETLSEWQTLRRQYRVDKWAWSSRPLV